MRRRWINGLEILKRKRFGTYVLHCRPGVNLRRPRNVPCDDAGDAGPAGSSQKRTPGNSVGNPWFSKTQQKTRQKPFPSHESESTTLAKSSEESKQYQTLLHTRELHPNFTQHWAKPVNTSQLTGIWTWPRTRKHYTKVTRTRTKLTFRAK